MTPRLIRGRPPATPPEDVWAVMPDGSEIPIEVVYDGWDGQVHRWERGHPPRPGAEDGSGWRAAAQDGCRCSV